MYWPLLMLKWETHGKFLHDAIKTGRDIRVKPGTLIHRQLRHFIEENAKYREKVAGKSAEQEFHEVSIQYYQEMLKNSTTEDEQRYAENHIGAHQQRLEEATKRFEELLAEESNAVPN